jgi:hypothetical protein
MSDALRGRIPDLEDQPVVAAAENGAGYVHCTINVSNNEMPIVGLTCSALLCEKPELELKVMLDTAMDLAARKGDTVIESIELQHLDRKVTIDGPFMIVALRLQEIDARTQVCVLAMQLDAAIASYDQEKGA